MVGGFGRIETNAHLSASTQGVATLKILYDCVIYMSTLPLLYADLELNYILFVLKLKF